MKMKKHTIVATCASGIEQLLASEIVPAGGSDIVETRGAVSFQGDLGCPCRPFSGKDREPSFGQHITARYQD